MLPALYLQLQGDPPVSNARHKHLSKAFRLLNNHIITTYSRRASGVPDTLFLFVTPVTSSTYLTRKQLSLSNHNCTFSRDQILQSNNMELLKACKTNSMLPCGRTANKSSLTYYHGCVLVYIKKPLYVIDGVDLITFPVKH